MKNIKVLWRYYKPLMDRAVKGDAFKYPTIMKIFHNSKKDGYEYEVWEMRNLNGDGTLVVSSYSVGGRCEPLYKKPSKGYKLIHILDVGDSKTKRYAGYNELDSVLRRKIK